jgi:hypothetical protein
MLRTWWVCDVDALRAFVTIKFVWAKVSSRKSEHVALGKGFQDQCCNPVALRSAPLLLIFGMDKYEKVAKRIASTRT